MLLERGESDYFLGAYTLNLIAVEILLALGFLVVMVVHGRTHRTLSTVELSYDSARCFATLSPTLARFRSHVPPPHARISSLASNSRRYSPAG